MPTNTTISPTVIDSTVSNKQKKKKSGNKILFWATECRYSVILDHVQELDWKLVDDERLQSKLNLFWIDVASIHEHFRHIQPWQMINHFPGMPNIARKNRMGQNLNRMQKLFPKEYSFYPRTWVLPSEMNDFRTQFDSSGNSLNNKIFIIKPDAGCQGRGIFLTRTIENVPFNENVVAQVYIKKPLLIDGYKFDLRLYCIVTCVKPLRMFLFHDGLVRMCTEEYVKPTKDNLGMACMHLTNYAVNKHNENFQQPSAVSSEECQDEGSKRSLLWFMNWIRKEHGDTKANWLWKRMGTLCTRTVISILPILSREYDQHFKSFSGIPVDINQIPSSNGLSNTPSLVKPPLGIKTKSTQSNLRSRSTKEGGSDDEEDETQEIDPQLLASEESTKDTSTDTEDGNDDKTTGPKVRGSRCFEVLGFDIMIDGNLNPWLIEVNHLPSFGTDSALDKDIKERLMQQVFSVLPVMADDQLAYNAFHKAEAEKRLAAQKVAKEQQLAALTTGKDSSKSKLPPTRPARRSDKTSSTASFDEKMYEQSITEDAESATRVDTENDDKAGADAGLVEGEFTEPSTKSETESVDPTISEVCTADRVAEIKQILIDIYEKKSPEKINKIERLLAKYNGHEEEFLLFVFSKYAVDPSEYENAKPKAMREAELQVFSNDSQSNNSADRDDIPKDTSDLPSMFTSEASSSNNHRGPSKRYSRSLSPPRSLPNNKRPTAAWKQSQPDEEAAFKQEILSTHVPFESDEWMRLEVSRLTQCTRIFPLEPTGDGKIGDKTEEEDKEEQEENDEENDEKQEKRKLEKAAKSATYEEIIIQVFLQDRRQTMRLRCPLPNRAKPESEISNNFLPPLDAPPSGRSSLSTLGSGKGVVGWKAPPKPVRTEAPKQPTASQAESAKRLSQGLSVATTIRNRNATNPTTVTGNQPTINETQYSVVLDPQEYNAVTGYVPVQNGAYTNGNYIIWPSTKAHRLYEESRNNRLRIEAARASNGAVLRQQIFFFDPNQETSNPSTAPNAFGSGNSSVFSSVNGTIPVVNTSQILGDQQAFINSIPEYISNGNELGNVSTTNFHPTVGVGGTRSSFSQSKIPYSVVSTGGIIPSNTPTYYMNNNGQTVNTSNTYYSTGNSSKPAMNGNNGNNILRNPVPSTMQMHSGMSVSAQGIQGVGVGQGVTNAGAANTKQEELLRQLFPSWF